MVELQPSKLAMGVRFPSPAPRAPVAQGTEQRTFNLPVIEPNFAAATEARLERPRRYSRWLRETCAYILDVRRKPVRETWSCQPGQGDRTNRSSPASTHGTEYAGSTSCPSDGWLRTVLENISDVICVLGADGTFLYVSPAIEKVLGYLPADQPLTPLPHARGSDWQDAS
jgi:PAS domain-containing protein